MIVERTKDYNLVRKALDLYQCDYRGLDLAAWLSCDENVALTNEYKDVSLFERQELNPVSVHGHYFYHSRGRRALEMAEASLHEIFTGPYGVGVIVGLTPVEHKGARWMNRRLGFKSMGIVPTVEGDHENVILTKVMWETQDNE